MKTPTQTIKEIDRQIAEIKRYSKGVIEWEESPGLNGMMRALKGIKKFIKNI